jgi:hypothetical protein
MDRDRLELEPYRALREDEPAGQPRSRIADGPKRTRPARTPGLKTRWSCGWTPALAGLEVRRESAGPSAITMRDLLRATLRHQPDRVPAGEVPAAEPVVCSKPEHGHSGTLSTTGELGRTILASGHLGLRQSGVDLQDPAIAAPSRTVLQTARGPARRGGCCVVTQPVRVRRCDTPTTAATRSPRWRIGPAG